MNLLMQKRWNPFFAGAVSGCVSILSVWVAGNYIGASTTFVRSAGLIEKIIAPEHVEKLDYFIKTTPKIDWQWMFVLGIFLGALLSALLSGDFKIKKVPDMWESRFGPNVPKRAIVAFVGGTVSLFGARLADG